MAVRSSMAALISRVRLLINDTGTTQQFDDQTIQDVLDEGRMDIVNQQLLGKPTFTGSLIEYLDYYSEIGGGWEDDFVLKQYLTVPVTPSSVEPIAGHFVFAQTTLPPIFITGKLHDVYRGAADLLERLSEQYALSFDFTSDGQSFRRSQAGPLLQTLAKTYRMKQRAISLKAIRSDIAGNDTGPLTLQPTEIDYMGSGDGR
jgi:hypothetical protein